MPTTIRYTRVNMTRFKKQIADYTKAHHKQIQELTREAVRVFVHTIVQNYIVIDTGMSAASLEPLAQEVGTTIIDVVVQRRKRAYRKGRETLSGTWYRNSKRDIDAGVKAGYNAYTLTFGNVNQPLINFEFRIKVFQYWFHEPTWQTLEAGRQAFIRFIETNYTDYLPKDLNILLNAYSTVDLRVRS